MIMRHPCLTLKTKTIPAFLWLPLSFMRENDDLIYVLLFLFVIALKTKMHRWLVRNMRMYQCNHSRYFREFRLLEYFYKIFNQIYFFI